MLIDDDSDDEDTTTTMIKISCSITLLNVFKRESCETASKVRITVRRGSRIINIIIITALIIIIIITTVHFVIYLTIKY